MTSRAASPSEMKVLLGVPWYFPDSVGGTEVYVRGLAQQLLQRGIDVVVAAPIQGDGPTEYVNEGVRVLRYPAPYASSGEIDLNRVEPEAWGELLDRVAPTIVDLHALTSGLELAHLKAARRRNMRTVVTLHIPGVICARGTFMRFGTTPCTGNIASEPCTACRLEAQGTSPLASRMIAAMPSGLGEIVGRIPFPSSLRRAMRATSLDRHRRQWLREIINAADRIVAPSAWLVEVLLKNHAAPDRVVLCRQGVDAGCMTQASKPADGAHPLRVGFLGRYDHVKGLHVLVEAIKRVPQTSAIELHIWGVARSSADHAYRQTIIDSAQGDRRIVVHEESAHPADAYRQIDLLAVPSIWLETGPLVILEAQAAAVPVIGSRLGGIAERVTDGVDGLLVPPGDAGALARALTELADDPGRVAALRPRFTPRTTVDVADETWRTYEALLRSRAA
jgi:glycosyltransferase involved in cell wall biosynthesis